MIVELPSRCKRVMGGNAPKEGKPVPRYRKSRPEVGKTPTHSLRRFVRTIWQMRSTYVGLSLSCVAARFGRIVASPRLPTARQNPVFQAACPGSAGTIDRSPSAYKLVSTRPDLIPPYIPEYFRDQDDRHCDADENSSDSSPAGTSIRQSQLCGTDRPILHLSHIQLLLKAHRHRLPQLPPHRNRLVPVPP